MTEQQTDQATGQTNRLLLRATSVLLFAFAFGFGTVHIVHLWAR